MRTARFVQVNLYHTATSKSWKSINLTRFLIPTQILPLHNPMTGLNHFIQAIHDIGQHHESNILPGIFFSEQREILQTQYSKTFKVCVRDSPISGFATKASYGLK